MTALPAAEYLIAQKWTNLAARLARGVERRPPRGSSRGTAARSFRRGDSAGRVLDMLRFRDFTVGKGWESDYGSVDNAQEFKALLAYSPYQNVKANVDYPATLIITGDHDDRVFPAHSFQVAAAMQHAHPKATPS